MHRYLHVDAGLECFACGILLDYRDEMIAADSGDDTDFSDLESAARELAFGLCRPKVRRAHHYVLESVPPQPGAGPGTAFRLVCGYDSTTITDETLPDSVDSECAGA
jgi:hypothetical protein